MMPRSTLLAAGLRAHDLDIVWGLATLLRSRLFFDTANLGNRVSSPIEFAIGSARALEVLDPPPSTPVLADWCARLGQDMFYPPNVAGWPGGRDWISTRSAIGRANFAGALVQGEDVGLPGPADLRALAARHGTGAKSCVLLAIALRALTSRRLQSATELTCGGTSLACSLHRRVNSFK